MNRERAKRKATELVSKMTVDEKASQLRYNSPAISRLNVPAYNWWNEALHGVARAGTATSFPQAIAMAASFNKEMLYQIAEVIAIEGRAKYNQYSKEEDRDIYKGLTFWTPNVNIFRDPRWGRGHETYGEDPFLTGSLGVSFIKGLQGNGEYMKAAACAKHFAVHSGPEALRHEFNAVVGEKDLRETYLPAFEMCVKDGNVEAVMGAYNRMNGEPCCASKKLMIDILRGEWEFEGHYVSDCWAIRDFHEHHMVTSTPEESAALALRTGCDLNCGNTYLHIIKAYQEGLVTEDEITRSAVRLFTTRYMLGLFDVSEYDAIGYDKIECREHRELAVEAAFESIVLLKNNGILPLDKNKIKKIGVIGPNADSRAALIGNYHGTSSVNMTVLEGIREEAGTEIDVLYSLGCHLFKDRVEHLGEKQDRIAEATIVAKHSDVVVLCLGLDESLEGEEGDTGNSYASGDKEDLLLPKVQRELLEAVIQTGKPVIVCNMTGSAIDLSYAQEHAAAVLQLWYPGAGGGKAAAGILFGKKSPSGKLPVTFYRDLDGMPEFEDYSMKGRTYRYLEKDPLYPFGYGLTYSDIKVESASVTSNLSEIKEQILSDGAFIVEATLKNVGSVDASEVLQIYIKDLQSKNAVINHNLCGFKKVFLKSGETKKIELAIPVSALTIVDEEGKKYRESNQFCLYFGTSQPDNRSVELTQKECISLKLLI